MTLPWRKLVRWLGYTVATVIIFTAAIVSIGRLFTPVLMEHRADFETWASEFLHTPVTIKQVHISWYYYQPELSLDQVEVLDSQTRKPTFKIEEITINFEIIKSIFKRQPIPAYIKISGVHVTIQEQAKGQVNVVGVGSFSIKDNMTGANIGANAVADWLLTQRHLVLNDINFAYIPLHGDVKSITLHKLSLKNSGNRHALDGEATLNQEIPTHILLGLAWHGSSLDFAKISAHCYIYLEAVSLPQWIKNQSWDNLRINQGLGSAKVWADWDHNQWEKVQTEFQLYELELQSLLTKKSQVISRLNGEVGWKREGDKQVFYGEDILIDFPEHIWPTTRFSVTTSIDAASEKHIHQLQIGYLDLADSRELLLASGLFAGNVQTMLTSLNPSGEIRNVDIDFNDSVNLINNPSSAEFTDISVNEWQSVPGLAHFTGKLVWNGKEGNFKIESEDTTLTLQKVFIKPLEFTSLMGDIHWQKDANSNWVVKAKDLEAKNAELMAKINMDMVLIKGASPTIDLAADFSLANAAAINNYLPGKILDDDLNNWLRHAFIGGQLTSGKAILQGNLNDFPFDNGTGKFMISTAINDMDFHFAPNWPVIKQVNGRLVFAGHSMTADIDTAHMLNIPLKNVHGVIPYIGSAHPQILNIDTVIDADLARGLQFVHQSPLQKTIGSELSLMQLTGPMQLKLGLMIPLKTPTKTQVSGNIAMQDASLHLLASNLVLNHLQGAFQFTENSLTANQLQARLLNYPVKIQINTIKESPSLSYIQALFTSQMSVPDLEKLLGLNVSRFAKGSFNYTAEIRLMPKTQPKPSQLILRSNLQGVALNLPDQLGKEENTIQSLDITTNLGQDDTFLTTVRYGNLMTAAIALQKNNGHTEFQRGEIRFGAQGSATWPKEPGLLITGQLEKLDWDAIKAYYAGLDMGMVPASSAIDMSFLRAIDIKTKIAVAFGQTLTNASLQITPSQNNWVVGIDSPDVVGEVVIPRDNTQSPIQAKFQRITIKPMAAGNAMDPKTLPAISFLGEDVRYNDMRLGRVALDIEPNQTGLIIKSLRLSAPLYTLSMNGQWWSQKKGFRTRIEGNLNTKNVTAFLDTFGVKSSNLVDSGGSAVFDLTWPDAPYKPTMSGMTGYLDLKLTKGRIVDLGESTDAKMGLGRMLSVFSLQTLPRRLSFDFSDLFQKGYSFDSMNGNFTFKDGSAFTDNTQFDGPLAQVLIAGRIGFTAKDFDLTLHITPYVTGSLPLVATAIGGPVAGAVTFVLNKAVGSAVSKVATYGYHVEGPWDNPSWSEAKK